MDWDQRYAEEDTPWDKGVAHPEMEILIADGAFADWRGKKVIVPGAGRAYDVKSLAGQGVKALGVDISALAVSSAVTDEIVVGDFLNDCGAEWQVDVEGLWEHTCFCAIDPALRPRYVEAAAGCLAPGKFLKGIFFINPDMSPGENGPPFGCAEDELLEHFDPLFELVTRALPRATYAGREGREVYLELRRRP